MSLRTDLHTLRNAFRTHPVVMTGSSIGVLAFIVLFLWLSLTARWPESCDVAGGRIIGLLAKLRCSPDLLKGGIVEWALFACLWTLPIVVVGAFVYGFVAERSDSKEN